GFGNTALGTETLVHLGIGGQNTAVGFQAMLAVGYGNQMSRNTVVGADAMAFSGGNNNTAVGSYAMFGSSQLGGDHNIAIGDSAGYNLTTGSNNIDIANVGVAAEANTIRVGTVGTQSATYIAEIN